MVTPQHIAPLEIPLSDGQHAFAMRGTGPAMHICLRMCRLTSNGEGQNGAGLGDHIASLPVIYELSRRGYKITIYTSRSWFPLYEGLGIVCREAGDIYMGWADEHLSEFETIYSLFEWSLDNEAATHGNPNTDRTSLFASFFGIERPAEFNYRYALSAFPTPQDYIVYAPHAIEPEGMYRGYPYALQLGLLLADAHKTKWLAGYESNYTVKCNSLQEIVDLVRGAKACLTVDNGIMHLAMALGVPCFALFGKTDEHTITEPYRFYNPHALRAVLRRRPVDASCVRPCNGFPEKGFRQNNKCMTGAECMEEFSSQEILDSFAAFMESI
jgi:hypothetical protein